MGEWKQSNDGFSVVEVDSEEPKVGAGNSARDAQATGAVVEGDFDPAEHKVDDVKQYVTDNPTSRDAILEAEQAGKDRSSLVTWLEGFDASQE